MKSTSKIPDKPNRIKNFFNAFSERVILYVFPLFLVILELILKNAGGTNIDGFIGPTLASIGVGFALPLTIYKGIKNSSELPENTPEELKIALASLPKNTYYIIEPKHKVFANWCLVFTILLTTFWFGSVYLSTKQPHAVWLDQPIHNLLGYVSYFGGFILSEIKERL